VYPAKFCLPTNDTSSVWFRYLLSDEACEQYSLLGRFLANNRTVFHSVLAMSDVHEGSLLGRNQTSPRALWHLSNTYRCIKQNLEKNSTPSDSTVAAVMSMAIHEDLIGHPGRSKVHVEALHHIVELRGGITNFTDNQLLLQKVCR
jgi:Fungal specific transcription factor domain